MSALFLLLGLSCEGDHPLRSALDAYRDGETLLEEGRHPEAIRAFDQALFHQPGDPLLLLWRASALAGEGRYIEALEDVDRVLVTEGEWALAHYNRACWLTRLGDLTAAAGALQRALALGYNPLDAMVDEDLKALREAPEVLDFPWELPLELSGEPGPRFSGALWELEMSFLTWSDEDWGIASESPWPAALRWNKMVEDQRQEGPLVRRQLSWSFEVSGAGQHALGPWQVRARSLETRTEPLTLETRSVHDTPPLPSMPDPFMTLRERFQDIPLPGAGRRGEWIFLRWEPESRFSLRPTPEQLIRVEQRDGGQPRWFGVLAWSPGETQIVVSSEQGSLWEGSL